MMSFGSSQGTTSTPEPVWLPGQLGYTEQFVSPFKDVFGGDFSSPLAKSIYGFSKGAADKGLSDAAQKVASTQGLTAPAKAKIIGGFGDATIKSAGESSAATWQTALETLKQYALQPAGVAVKSSGGGGGSGGLCWIWTFFNGKNGMVTNVVRKYRDEVYGKGSNLDKGYKLMGKVVLPIMQKSPLLQRLIRSTIYVPITSFVFGNKNPFLWVYVKGWEVVWKGLGLAYSFNEELYQKIIVRK